MVFEAGGGAIEQFDNKISKRSLKRSLKRPLNYLKLNLSKVKILRPRVNEPKSTGSGLGKI